MAYSGTDTDGGEALTRRIKKEDCRKSEEKKPNKSIYACKSGQSTVLKNLEQVNDSFREAVGVAI